MVILFQLIEILLVLVSVLLSVAYLTLLERKILASIQIRVGPNVIGAYGLLQPFADALKLFLKETIIPLHADKKLLIFAPILGLFLSLISFAVVPFGEGLVLSEVPLSILYLFVISSLSVYSVILAGWASNSKFPILGAIRSTAQLISYDVAMGLVIINVILLAHSVNLTEIVMSQTNIWYIFPLWPSFLIFLVSSLAETSRPPFDLIECESELVAGHLIELSAMTFANYFLSEYAHVVLLALTTSYLFLGGWNIPSIVNIIPFTEKLIPEFISNNLSIGLSGNLILAIKVVLMLSLIIVIRASYPRYRYDHLMSLLWKQYLPFSLGLVIFTSSWIYLFA